MASIRVSSDEFGDIIIYLLLDSLRNEDELLGNPRYQALLKKLKLLGMEGLLLKWFLNMDTNTRIKYKRIKDSFTDNARNIIYIGGEPIEEPVVENTGAAPFNRELCKRIFRKVKEVRFKRNLPITEERLDKIIDYCVREHDKTNGGSTNG